MDKITKIKLFIKHTWYVIIPIAFCMMVFGFLVGIGAGYEETEVPECKVAEPCPSLPEIDCPICENSTLACVNTTVYKERCTNNDTNILNYINQIKNLDNSLEVCYNTTVWDNISNDLSQCKNDLRDIKEVLG